MAVAAWDLTTLAELRTFLNIVSTHTDHDALLQSLITQVSGLFNKETHRYLIAKEYSASIFDAPSGDTLYLPQYPVKEITSLVDNGTTITVASHFLYKDEGKFVLDDSNFSGERQGITISFEAGYDSENTDHDPDLANLKNLCNTLASRWFQISPAHLEHYQAINEETSMAPEVQFDIMPFDITRKLSAYKKRDRF